MVPLPEMLSVLYIQWIYLVVSLGEKHVGCGDKWSEASLRSHCQESGQCYTSNGSTLLFLSAKSMLAVGISGQRLPHDPTARKVVNVIHLMDLPCCFSG